MCNNCTNPITAAERAENLKMRRYRTSCEAEGMLFELLRAIHLRDDRGLGIAYSLKGIRERLARAVADISRNDLPSALKELRDKVAFAAQKSMAEGFIYRNEVDGRV